MNQPKQQVAFKKTILALSLMAAVGSAYADDDEVAQLTKNESTISLGAAGVSGKTSDRSILGQYNGLRDNSNSLYPLVDISIIKLQESTGTWTRIDGRNLGLDNRDLSISQNKQGDWKYTFEYNEITHHDIRTVNSGVASAGAGANLNFQLQRQNITVSAEKWLTPNLLFETSAKNEDKTGTRLSGEGVACSSIGFPSRYSCGGGVSQSGALLMLPEPVSTNTQQLEAKLNYSGKQFLITGGYYGSFFSNSKGSYTPAINGTLTNPGGATITLSNPGLSTYLTAPVSLQPNNQAQQFYVSGNYAFTQTTHSTFKYSYTHASQNQSFSDMGLTGGPAGISNLNGSVDTNLVQFGFTSRPISRLSLIANVRYEDKNDKTLQANYNQTQSGKLYSNDYSSSSKKINGKLEAKYQLPYNYNATVGVDYATVQRATPPSISSTEATDLATSLAGLREKTHEVTYRAELRRALTDQLNGSVSYLHSERSGDSWTLYSTTGTLPMTMLDRKRDKVRLSADWTPISKVAVQFNYEKGTDTFNGPVQGGMRDGSMGAYGVDATLNLSEKWKLIGYANQSNQSQHISHFTSMAELDDINTSFGFGLGYKPTSKWDLGANATYVNDTNRYLVGGLPDVTYRVVNLKLFGKYAVQKDSDVRIDLVHQSAKLDEWTWGNNGTPFTYSDGSTVSLQPNQIMNYVGASYIVKFR